MSLLICLGDLCKLVLIGVFRAAADDWDGAESDSADTVSESEECVAGAGGAAWRGGAAGGECGGTDSECCVFGWVVAHCDCHDGIDGGVNGPSMSDAANGIECLQ